MSCKANVSCCCLKMTMISRRGDANRDTIKSCTLAIGKALALILQRNCFVYAITNHDCDILTSEGITCCLPPSSLKQYKVIKSALLWNHLSRWLAQNNTISLVLGFSWLFFNLTRPEGNGLIWSPPIRLWAACYTYNEKHCMWRKCTFNNLFFI